MGKNHKKKVKKSKLDKHENKYWHIPREVVGPTIALIIFAILAISLYVFSTQTHIEGDVGDVALFFSILFTIASLFSIFILLVEWSCANDKIKLLKQGKKKIWVGGYHKKKTVTKIEKVYVPSHSKIVKIKKK